MTSKLSLVSVRLRVFHDELTGPKKTVPWAVFHRGILVEFGRDSTAGVVDFTESRTIAVRFLRELDLR